jgi:hypothetical protein
MLGRILNHFKYPSTINSIIIAAAGLFGFVITPELQEQIVALTVALVSVVMFFFSDADVKEDN